MSEPRTIWASYSAYFHGISEVEIDSKKATDGTDMIEVSFKNSSGQGGQVVLFLDEGYRLKWPMKAMKKVKGRWIPGKMKFLMKKKEEK